MHSAGPSAAATVCDSGMHLMDELVKHSRRRVHDTETAEKARSLLSKLSGGSTFNFKRRVGVDLVLSTSSSHNKLFDLFDELTKADQKRKQMARFEQQPQQQSRNYETPNAELMRKTTKRQRRQYRIAQRNNWSYNMEQQHMVMEPTMVEDPLHWSISLARTNFLYVDNIHALGQMAQILRASSMFAFDTETTCHKYRDHGHPRKPEICLLQISTESTERANDFIVDLEVPEVRSMINTALGPIFANRDITKIVHGNDCRFLHEQFGINTKGQIVETSHNGQRRLEQYVWQWCGIRLEKTERTSNWRKRPLSEGQLLYARLDSHFLFRAFQRQQQMGGDR